MCVSKEQSLRSGFCRAAIAPLNFKVVEIGICCPKAGDEILNGTVTSTS
jgi:hypothetical protein